MNNLYKNAKFGGTALAILLASSFAIAYGQGHGNGNNQPSGQGGAQTSANVVVTNTPAQPVPTKEQNNPAFQPFHFTGYLTVTGGLGNIYVPVPAGKRLVIEQISSEVQVIQTTGSIPRFGMHSAAAGADAYMFAPMTWAGPSDSGALYVGVQQTRMYADGGTRDRKSVV